MQKRGYTNGSSVTSLLILLQLVLLIAISGCRGRLTDNGPDADERTNSQLTVAEINTGLIRFTTFQNQDSTWGYTVFINSRPYLRMSKMPFRKASSGFRTNEDARIVAQAMVNMIREGNIAAKFDKKTLDSLEYKLKIK